MCGVIVCGWYFHVWRAIVLGVWWNGTDVMCCISGNVLVNFHREWVSLRNMMVMFWVCPTFTPLQQKWIP